MEASARRANWQRKFNQQALYHPSTSSSVSESSSTPGSTDTSPGNSIPNSARDVPKDNLPRERKWWLHVQPPELGQALNDLEFAALSSGIGLNKDTKLSEEFDARYFESLDGLELKAALDSSHPHIPKKKQGLNEFDYSKHNLVREKTQKEVYPETESPWSEAEKTEPWWRHANKDELASFVAQKSVEHIENCDLPRPRKKLSKLVLSTTGSTNPASLCENKCVITNDSCTVHGFEGPFSETDDKTIEDEGQSQTTSEPTKSELLEALCHSQTRAREAEEAAQQAYTEKEHILSLFFRQASQLFAYRQWFQMLQLQSFYLQLENPNPNPPALNKGKKNRHNGGSWWVSGKSVVASAIGLGLAGAGFLLGWTLGWLFR